MEEKKYCVYIHRSPSNKAYIGITSMVPEERWDGGRGYFKKTKNGNYHQPAMVNAINKYGWDNFKHIIFESNLTKAEAEYMEKMLILLWETNNPKYGYNIRSGGGSVGPLPESTKKKMSESHKGYHPTEETRRKLSEANSGERHPMYGKHHTEETRQKMRESHKNNPMSEENRKKVSERFKGKKRPEESVRKTADSHKKPVFCFELNQAFDSVASAATAGGITYSTLSWYLHGNGNYAGTHPVTGEKLHWKFIE